MADRKSFLLRIDGDVLDGVRRWADGDLRSLNSQIEFLLRKALRDAGRLHHTEPVEHPRDPKDSPQEAD